MKKICSKCGDEKDIKEFYYHRQRKRYMSSCKFCNNSHSRKQNKKTKENDILIYQLRQRASELVRRSKNKNIPYEKKMFHSLKEIFNHQKGLCYYTEFKLEYVGYKDNNPYCFVIDKINPELGYVKDNMVFCCNAVNKIKSSFTITELRWWVNQIKIIN